MASSIITLRAAGSISHTGGRDVRKFVVASRTSSSSPSLRVDGGVAGLNWNVDVDGSGDCDRVGGYNGGGGVCERSGGGCDDGVDGGGVCERGDGDDVGGVSKNDGVIGDAAICLFFNNTHRRSFSAYGGVIPLHAIIFPS